MNISRLTAMIMMVVLLGSLTGCANEFFAFDSSGSPLLISRRAFTSDDCMGKIKNDAVRMGVTLRYIHVRGTMAGRSLLWPLEPGYACEAAIGPEQGPIGTYPMERGLPPQGS